MSTASRRSRWVHPGKILYAAYEWWIMRWLLVWSVYSSFKLAGYDALHYTTTTGRGPDFMTQPRPRGLAQFMDVTWVNEPEHIPQVALAIAILLVLLGLGLTPVLAALGLAYLQTMVGTLENSQGNNVWHTSQVLVFALLGVGLAGLAEYFQAWRRGALRERWCQRWRWLARMRQAPWAAATRPAIDALEQNEARSRSFTIYLVQQFLATTYVVSAVSKFWISHGEWFSDVKHIGLQFEKNRLLKYYQSLEMPPGFGWAGDFVNAHPSLTCWCFSLGLFLELFCFIALFNRGLLLAFGLGLIAMHLMIAQLMALEFYYNEWLLAIFYVNAPFWILWLSQRFRKPLPV